MVYCDRCGNKAYSLDRYCRICGAIIHRPPPSILSSRIKRKPLRKVNLPQLISEPEKKDEAPEREVHRETSPKLPQLISEPEKKMEGTPEREVHRETSPSLQDERHTSNGRESVVSLEVPNDNWKQLNRSTTTMSVYRPKVEAKMDEGSEELHSNLEDLENLENLEDLKKENQSLRNQLGTKHRLRSAGGAMIVVGVISLFASVVFGSSVLAFIGLGLTFWGVLLIFARAA